MAADVASQGLDGLLAHARILSQVRDECVAHMMWTVAHASGFAGDSPRFAPGTHWTVEIHAERTGRREFPLMPTLWYGKRKLSDPASGNRSSHTDRQAHTGGKAESYGPHPPWSCSFATTNSPLMMKPTRIGMD